PPPEPVPMPAPPPPPPSPPPPSGPSLDIYGFAMLDMGYDFGTVGDPDWFDTLRPTRLPSVEDGFGKDGRFFAGVRQTRFGVKGHMPTQWGDLLAHFEFELFGV